MLERQEEDPRGSETLLLSMMPVKELKETSVEKLEASNIKRERILESTAGDRVTLTVHGRVLAIVERLKRDLT